jgi:hypothetical protein
MITRLQEGSSGPCAQEICIEATWLPGLRLHLLSKLARDLRPQLTNEANFRFERCILFLQFRHFSLDLAVSPGVHHALPSPCTPLAGTQQKMSDSGWKLNSRLSDCVHAQRAIRSAGDGVSPSALARRSKPAPTHGLQLNGRHLSGGAWHPGNNHSPITGAEDVAAISFTAQESVRFPDAPGHPAHAGAHVLSAAAADSGIFAFARVF